MKRFQCQACGQPLQFEDTACPSCERPVGYLPGLETMTALEPTDAAWRTLADRGATYRPCDNREYGVCNWLVPADAAQTRCVACRHNRMIPYLGAPEFAEEQASRIELCSVISADIITGIDWCGVPNWTRFARSSEMSRRIMRARCRSTTESVV
jgi:hypothetical protein